MDVATIHRQFNEQISGFICHKVSMDRCHDILQEMYIKIMMNLNKLEKVENIKSYLLKIADNSINAAMLQKNIFNARTFIYLRRYEKAAIAFTILHVVSFLYALCRQGNRQCG